MDRQKQLGEGSIPKLLMKYSVPAIIGMLVNSLYNIVDRIFIGKMPDVGAMAITGLGITMPVTSIILGVGMLVGIGATANISLKLGANKREEAERILGQVVSLSVIFSIIITVIGVVFVGDILMAFGASEDTIFYAEEYINIIILGSIFNVTSFALNSTIRADGNPKLSATIMGLSCLTNIVLDAVFIYVFNWGIKGASIATVISQALGMFVMIYYYTKGSSNLKLRMKNLKIDKKSVLLILSIGMSPFAMQIAASMVQVISNNSLKIYGGDMAIGAMAAINSISMMFMMPTFGLNQGVQPIIGYNYGAQKYQRAKDATKYAMGAAVVILTIGFILIQTFPEFAIGLFNEDPRLLEIGVPGIRISMMALPLIGLAVIGGTYFQAIGKAKISMILSILRQVILLIPFILIFPKFIGLNGIWLAITTSDILSVIITCTCLAKEFKNTKEELLLEEAVS